MSGGAARKCGLALQQEIGEFLSRRAEPWWPWYVVPKGDVRCRAMADRHYTRQTVGAAQWTRPGFTLVLYAADTAGEACFVWWRPKWESVSPFTARKDGLRVLECTMFRRERLSRLSSELIRAAVVALEAPQAATSLRYATMGAVDWLITGIGSAATARGRSTRSLAGACFRHAGWEEFDKGGTGRADVWLRYPAPRKCGPYGGTRA